MRWIDGAFTWAGTEEVVSQSWLRWWLQFRIVETCHCSRTLILRVLHLLLLCLHPTLQIIITKLSSISGRNWSGHSTTESSLSFYLWVRVILSRWRMYIDPVPDKRIDGDRVHSVRLELADPYVQFISSFHQKTVAQRRTGGGDVKQNFILLIRMILQKFWILWVTTHSFLSACPVTANTIGDFKNSSQLVAKLQVLCSK